jgi:hypothetical protein
MLIPSKRAPSQEFPAAEIWTSFGVVSRVSFTQASRLARTQSGDVQDGKRQSLNVPVSLPETKVSSDTIVQ